MHATPAPSIQPTLGQTRHVGRQARSPRYDVVAIRERGGGCATGAVGAAVSVYDDAALLGASDHMTGRRAACLSSLRSCPK